MPASIQLPQFSIEHVRVGLVRVQRVHTIKFLCQRRVRVIMCGKGLGKKLLAAPQRRAWQTDVIEYHQRCITEPMTPTERLAIEPLDRYALALQPDHTQ